MVIFSFIKESLNWTRFFGIRSPSKKRKTQIPQSSSLPPNSAVADTPSPLNRPNPPEQRCRTTTQRLKTWSGTRNCRPSHTHAPAATCSRSPRRILSSAKRLLGALAALFTSRSSTTWKIFLETLIRRITKELSPLNNSLSWSLNNSGY